MSSEDMKQPPKKAKKVMAAEFGPQVYYGEELVYAFSAQVRLDERKGPDTKLTPGEEKERTIEEMLDLSDITGLSVEQFKALSQADRAAAQSKARVLEMLASGRVPAHKGRGCEIMVDDGAVIFLQLENRDPVRKALVHVKVNDQTAIVMVLSPNEKVNVRHPCVGVTDEEKKIDRMKWVIMTQDKYQADCTAKGQQIGASHKELKNKIISEAPNIEVVFSPEHTAEDAKVEGAATKSTANAPELYDPAVGIECKTAWGTRFVKAVKSKTYRPAVKIEGGTLGTKKVYEDFTVAAVGHAACVGQGEEFSSLLYEPCPDAFTVRKNLDAAETLTRFSFLINK